VPRVGSTVATTVLVSLLLASVSACQATPDGTLTKHQVPGADSAANRDGIANQVNCEEINDNEDRLVEVQPADEDGQAPSVVFELGTNPHEWVDNSVWPVGDPKRSLERIAAGIDDCVAQEPDAYQRIDTVKGYPDAIGYTASENNPRDYTRRILVPLKDRVVVVGARREGDDDFSVPPEDLLDKAVTAAPNASTD
jgi:hypothetical protein